MVIEWLRFQVDPSKKDWFLKQDQEIWTEALAKYPGFLDKAVWLDPHVPDSIVMVIQWSSYEQWQAIPPEDLAEIEQRFQQRLQGEEPVRYKMVEAKEYLPQNPD